MCYDIELNPIQSYYKVIYQLQNCVQFLKLLISNQCDEIQWEDFTQLYSFHRHKQEVDTVHQY